MAATTTNKNTFKPKKGEEGHAHVVIEQVNHTQEGKKVSTPFTAQYDLSGWNNFLKFGKTQLGYSIIKVLHLPKGFEKPKPEFFWKNPNEA